MMDPLGVATPDVDGFVDLSETVRVHYELYRPPAVGSSSVNSSSTPNSTLASKSPLLMVMGAFATKVHFMDMARHLADKSGHEVCIYDHRGVGKSSPPKLEAQTAAQLAADAVVVADTLWGACTPLHVFGCVLIPVADVILMPKQ